MGKTVVIMLHRGRHPPAMQAAFATRACNQSDDYTFRTINSPYSVAAARNQGVRAMYDLDCENLLFVDEDVSVQEDCVTLLLELDSPVTVGQVPAIREISSLEIPYVPIISGNKPEVFGFLDFEFRWMGKSQEILRAGAACMLIQKKVLDELGFPWFRWPADLDEDDATGEDFDFCNRVRNLGFKIMVHADVRCGHAVTQDAGSRLVDFDQVAHNVNWVGPITQAQRHAYPGWGSHIPVLWTLAEEYPIKSVIEFGIGKYSTRVFLSRDFFPDLEKLISFENNVVWKDFVLDKLDDIRMEIAFGDLGAMPDRSRMMPAPDLVLVDCDAEADGDASKPFNVGMDSPPGFVFYTYKTRQAIFERYADTDAIVVVHDTNEEEMAAIITSGLYRFSSTYKPCTASMNPETSVFSNKHDVSKIEWRHTKNSRRWDDL